MQGTPGTRTGACSSFTLKVCAIVGMTCCHASVIFGGALPFWLACLLMAPGGLTFPIMAFQIDEGYRHTSSLKRYAARLAVCAAISQIPFSLAFPPESVDFGAFGFTPPITGDVIWTLLLGLGLNKLHDAMHGRPAYWLAFCLATLASAVLDWGIIGPVMMIMTHLLTDPRQRAVWPAALPVIALGLPALASVAAGDLTALPSLLYEVVGGIGACALLASYSGRRGRPLKWLFYAYYPGHLLALWLVARLAGIA